MKLYEGKIRPDEMTNKERMMALIKGEPMDRVPFVPFILGFAARNVGMPVADFYEDPEKSYWASEMTQMQYGYDGTPILGYGEYGGWEFGGQARYPYSQKEQGISITRHAVESEEMGWDLQLPDVETAGYLPKLMEFSKLEAKKGRRVSCYGLTPFAMAFNVAGSERFLRWLRKEPDLCHHLLRLATEHRIQVLEYWIKTFGVEHIRVQNQSGMDSNYLISPKAFVEFAFPYVKELHERILGMGITSIYCHLCGDQNLNMPFWAQVPFGDPGMVSIGHEVDIEAAIKYLGDNVIIFGNIEPALIMTGTPEQVYEKCRIAIEKGKKAPRGFVLMAGCEVPVFTPPINLWAMRKAINDFGWYNK
jgi:uroporphyrinogen decarboxylase